MRFSRIIKIDDLTRPDHTYLTEGDRCYYLMEYTSRQGYSYSPENSIINNIKKPVSTRRTRQWEYKIQEIQNIGNAFRGILGQDIIQQAVWVPVPPSKHRDHPEYDDRMLRVLQHMGREYGIDIREMITTRATIAASHQSDIRPSIEDIKNNLQLDTSAFEAIPPKPIVLFDDMITAGAHFKACQQLILEHEPDANIIGIFIARRVFREET